MIGKYIWLITIFILILVLLSYFTKSMDNKKEFIKKYMKIILTSILLWFFWVLIFKWNINLLLFIMISFFIVIILTEKRFHQTLKIIGLLFLILIFVLYNCISFSTKSTLYLDYLNTINKIEYIEEFQYENETIVISKHKVSDEHYYYSFNIYDNLFNVFKYKNQSDHLSKYYEYNEYKDGMLLSKSIIFKVYPLNDNKYLFLYQFSNLKINDSIFVNNYQVEIHGQDDKYIYFILDSIPNNIILNGETLNLKSR